MAVYQSSKSVSSNPIRRIKARRVRGFNQPARKPPTSAGTFKRRSREKDWRSAPHPGPRVSRPASMIGTPRAAKRFFATGHLPERLPAGRRVDPQWPMRRFAKPRCPLGRDDAPAGRSGFKYLSHANDL
jgi:hypothetical protein